MDADLQEDIEIFNHYKSLFLTDEQIKYSLFQQVTSIFQPKKFPLFEDKAWMKWVPISQLEKIVYKNLRKHKLQKGVKLC